MPRAISVSYETGISQPITRPGHLVAVDFSSPWRVSTRGNFKFFGVPFNAGGVDIRQLGQTSGQLVIDDLDRTFTAYALSESLPESRVRVWSFYGDPVENSDIAYWNPWLIFDGYGDDCVFDPNSGRAALTLVGASSRTLYTPRLRMTRENGFNYLPPKGKVFYFGGEKFVAEPE